MRTPPGRQGRHPKANPAGAGTPAIPAGTTASPATPPPAVPTTIQAITRATPAAGGAGPGFWRASAVTAIVVVATASIGTRWVRRWGGVPFSTPSWPWYFSFPFYIFWWPRMAPGWLALGLPVAAVAAVGVVAVHRAPARRALRVALTALLLAVLTLAIGLLRQGPPGWWEPLAYHGEYPGGVGVVAGAGGIRAFLGRFPDLLPSLPGHATGHPPGPMVFYTLVASVRPGVAAAALATVAVGCLGAVNAGGLGHDELGDAGGRLTLALWALSPVVILYTATSADTVFAAALA